LPGDSKLIQGANETKNDQNWLNQVNADIGDVVGCIIYYHNDVEKSVSKNTIVQIRATEQSANNEIKIIGKISSANTTEITDVLILKTDDKATIKLVPDSVKWFPAAVTNNTGSFALPSNQKGENILTIKSLRRIIYIFSLYVLYFPLFSFVTFASYVTFFLFSYVFIQISPKRVERLDQAQALLLAGALDLPLALLSRQDILRRLIIHQLHQAVPAREHTAVSRAVLRHPPF
jgi:hypothetical protein